MSDTRLLHAKDLDAFIAAVGKSSTFIAPAAMGEGNAAAETLFRPVATAAEMYLDRVNTRL